MDIAKLKILGEAAKYDICSSTASTKKIANSEIGNPLPSGICHSFTPDGRCVSLFKVLMTNECEKDCSYCPNRVQRDVPRVSFNPQELSKLFMEFYERNYVEGLFLSSGVRHGMSKTMDDMLKTVEILRYKYRFGGYIHLKILPGTTQEYIEQAAMLSNRISINLEAPNSNRLTVLSKSKNFETELLKPISIVADTLKNHRSVTHTTQYIVGAAGESDSEILRSVTSLYSSYNLKRAYFSAFQPVPDTPLQYLTSTPMIREHRLYQSDFLMRLYDFKYEDLVFDVKGNLDSALDPKLMYAVRNSQLFPMEINSASYDMLLRVPGIGPKSALKIVRARRQYRFVYPTDLKNMGISLKRCLKFITINGKHYDNLSWVLNPCLQEYEQLNMFKEVSL
ncbi:MAG: putative DNA modification/repair radical SAM protein [Bacillota bacterium]